LPQLDPRYPASATPTALSQILADPRRSLLVAERAGVVVGTADLLLVPNLSHGDRPWAIVENLVVDAEERGGGVGRLLMNEAISRADATRAVDPRQQVQNRRLPAARRPRDRKQGHALHPEAHLVHDPKPPRADHARQALCDDQIAGFDGSGRRQDAPPMRRPPLSRDGSSLRLPCSLSSRLDSQMVSS
jgi:GNAT superfamily N-acetyltransferase